MDASSPSPSPSPSLFTAGLRPAHHSWPRRLALLVVGLWVMWFGGVNLILALHLIPQAINSHNPIVVLDYERAWTYWPGTVHLEGFWIRGRDDEHLEFRFDVGTANVVVDLPALLHMKFHTTQVRIDGLDARFRVLFDPTERVLAHRQEAVLPPIDGYADPPMRRLGPAAVPVDDLHYAYWTVALDDVQVTHLRQLWVQEYRFRMDGSVDGHFALRPERAFDLTLARVGIAGAWLTIGPETAVEGLDGVATCLVERFDPRDIVGYQFMHLVSGSLQGTATVPNLRFLRHHLSGLGLSGGGGPLVLGVVIDHGLLAEGTQINLRGAPVLLESDRLALRGPLHLDARVVGEGRTLRGSLKLEVTPVTLALRSEVGATVSGPAVAVQVTTRDLDLADPFHDWGVTLDAERLKAPLAPWLRMVPKALAIDSGEVTLDTHLSFGAPSEQGKGHIHAVSDQVQGRIAGRKVSASIEAVLAIDRFSVPERTLELAGSEFSFRAASAPSLDHSVGGWWLKAELDRGSLDLTGSPVVEATAHVHARDARPILDFLAELGSLPHALTQALTLPNLEGRAQAHLEEGKLVLSPIRVTSGDTEVVATTSMGEALDATMMVHSGPLSLGLGIAHNNLSVNFLNGDNLLRTALLAAGRSPREFPMRAAADR